MSEHYERGPIQTYEVIWQSGHVEQIQAHQVMLPATDIGLLGVASLGPKRVTFHGEIDGRWMLVLDAAYEDIRTIRNVTATEEALS